VSKADAIIIDTIARAVPMLVMARDLLDRFHLMIRARKADVLDEWIA
jgi:hypothetical protein